ncbi:MAG: DDE-type integrase/transposase/recombinase [Gemmatimonadaceae bacterium]
MDKAQEIEALVRRFKEVLQEMESDGKVPEAVIPTTSSGNQSSPAAAVMAVDEHPRDLHAAFHVNADARRLPYPLNSAVADEHTDSDAPVTDATEVLQHGVYSTDIYEPQNPAIDTRDRNFEERLADDSGIEFGEKLGKEKTTLADELALYRREMVAPVINGLGSVPKIATDWRNALQGKESTLSVLVEDWPEHIKVRYSKLPERTFRRWVRTVKKDQEQARLTDTPPKPWIDLLRQTNTGPRLARIATPEVVELIRDIYLSNPAYSAALVALTLETNHKIILSERWVQKIIATEITDTERAEWRAGPAGTDVIFRKRLFRQSPYPNRAWIIDHSYVRQTTTVQQKPVDFEMHVREKTDRGFVVRIFLWMTAIVDACTGRTLIIKLHARQPNTTTTLTVLAEAIEKFGVPEILYSDNGSDLVSGQMKQALASLGIQQVCSMPYTPEGRGMIERRFRTIKEGVFPLLRGYQGNGKVDLAPEDLPTLEEAERHVQRFVERRFNDAYNKERRCIPSEKFDREVMGRRLLSSSQRRALMMVLMVDEGVVVSARGVRYKNEYYWGDCLTTAMQGMKVNVHVMPGRPLSLRLSTYTDGRVDVNDCSYIGVVTITSGDHPAPSFTKQRRMETRFLEERRENDAATEVFEDSHAEVECDAAMSLVAETGTQIVALARLGAGRDWQLAPAVSELRDQAGGTADAESGSTNRTVLRAMSTEEPSRKPLRKSYEEG